MLLTVSSSERMNGISLTVEERREIDKNLCSNFNRARSQLLSNFTDFMQRQSEDTSQLDMAFMQNSFQFLKELSELNIQTVGTYSSSIVLDLVFQNCSDLESFMAKVRDGQIDKLIQNTLATESVLSIMNLRFLQFAVSISDDDYENYHTKLQVQDVQSQRIPESKVTESST